VYYFVSCYFSNKRQLLTETALTGWSILWINGDSDMGGGGGEVKTGFLNLYFREIGLILIHNRFF
jgi:hypothetical protein